MAEAGLPGLEAGTWTALLAPAGTPPDITIRLNRELTNILRAPDVRDRLAAQGFDVRTTTLAEIAAYLHSEIVKWGKVVKATGARID